MRPAVAGVDVDADLAELVELGEHRVDPERVGLTAGEVLFDLRVCPEVIHTLRVPSGRVSERVFRHTLRLSVLRTTPANGFAPRFSALSLSASRPYSSDAALFIARASDSS